MTNEELKIKFTGFIPTVTFEESGEWLNVLLEPTDWRAFAEQIRTDESLQFDFLSAQQNFITILW